MIIMKRKTNCTVCIEGMKSLHRYIKCIELKRDYN